MPNKKYSMTVHADPKLHAAFAQACRVEGLTLSKGFEIALECILDKEVVEHRAVLMIGKPVCFSLDKSTAASFKEWAKDCLCQAHAVNTLLATALKNGFGAPITKKVA